MRNSMIAALLAVAVSAALAGPSGTPPVKKPAAKPAGGGAGAKPVNKGEYPAFDAEGYTLTFQQMDNRSKIDLSERGTKEHTVKVEGKMAPPKDDDAVAVTKEFTISSIVDGEKNAIVLPKTPGAGATAAPKALQEYKMYTYTPFVEGLADVEVPTTKIRKSANLIQEMELTSKVLLAEERADKTVPAVIMEKNDEVVPGAAFRITSLQLSPTHELTIIVKCDRNRGGPVGPFIEQAWVLDDNNEVGGGGRWSIGDPLGKTGTLTIKSPLAIGKTPKSIKFVACTKYTLKPLTFTVKDIFQK